MLLCLPSVFGILAVPCPIEGEMKQESSTVLWLLVGILRCYHRAALARRRKGKKHENVSKVSCRRRMMSKARILIDVDSMGSKLHSQLFLCVVVVSRIIPRLNPGGCEWLRT